MNEYRKHKFENKRFNVTDEIKNKTFINCFFHACRLSVPYNLVPEDRTRMIDCVFENCEFNGRSNFQDKGYLQNVLLHNIKNSDYMRIGGIIFDRVIFKGKFDKWILDSSHFGMMVDYQMIGEEESVPLDIYAESEYKNIEWALDISEAEFKECDLRPSIPAHLVKRNKETQILISYKNAIDIKSKNYIELKNYKAQSFFNYTIGSTKKDTIFVAPLRNPKKFKEYMEAFKILREEGIAKLD
jgi:hypothetical protein